MKVAILGATGETGSSIIDALLESQPTSGNNNTTFEVTALTRPSAVGGAEATALERRGVKIVATDLDGPKEALVAAVRGQDVVISTIRAWDLPKQIPLVDAAREAGVGRFVPCDFGTIAPPKGVMLLREGKEEIHNHIQKIRQPYTFIDVGWWYNISFPRVPSGRVDYATLYPSDSIPGDGNAKSAMTDKRDVGQWVRRIIADPRTLNKSVFAWNELLTTNEVYDIMEKLSGEKIERVYTPAETLEKGIADALASDLPEAKYIVATLQYSHSWGIRGDNTPEYAEYLGYLSAQELYPDFQPRTFEAFAKELLEGKVEKPYTRNAAMAATVQKSAGGLSSLETK